MEQLTKTLLIICTGIFLSACPSKKNVPDPTPTPTPPEPQVTKSFKELMWFEGRAPRAGSRMEMMRMLAGENKVLEIKKTI